MSISISDIKLLDNLICDTMYFNFSLGLMYFKIDKIGAQFAQTGIHIIEQQDLL